MGIHGGVAQRLEQRAHNLLVDGSIPSTPTILNLLMPLHSRWHITLLANMRESFIVTGDRPSFFSEGGEGRCPSKLLLTAVRTYGLL